MSSSSSGSYLPSALAALGLSALASACTESTWSSDAVTAPGTDTTDDGPTWHGEVQALVAAHCGACHVAGGIAPFSLTTWEDAAPLAPLIAGATRTRAMPPFPIDNSGACNTFEDARWLDDGSIALLSAWADAGAPRGDPTSSPPPPPELPRLTGEILRVSTGVDYTPRSGDRDDYRCFVVAPSAAPAVEHYVTGFDVHPGERRIVHHVIVYAPRTADAIADVHALDLAEDGPGYTCYGTAGVQASVLAAWAPGGGATHYPEGTGALLTPGAPLVIQVHYNTHGGEGLVDRTEVELELASTTVTRGRFIPVADLAMSLPPRAPEALAGVTIPASLYPSLDGPVLVRGVFPHMHELGTALSLDIVHPDGSTTCVARVPRWDFHWQMLYFLVSPVHLDPGDSLRIGCSFDTTTRDETTVWGESTRDEMCLAGLFVTPIDAP